MNTLDPGLGFPSTSIPTHAANPGTPAKRATLQVRSGQVKSGILPETLVPKSVTSRPKAYQESWDKPEVQSRPLDQSLAER